MDEKFFEFSNDDLGKPKYDFEDLKSFAADHDMDIDKAIHEVISDKEKIERYDLLNMVLVKVLMTKKLWRRNNTTELEKSLQKYMFLLIGMAKKWDGAVEVMGGSLLEEVQAELEEAKENLKEQGIDPDEVQEKFFASQKEAKKGKDTESLEERMNKNFFRKK